MLVYIVYSYYFALDQRVCMHVRSRMSKTTSTNFTKFSAHVASGGRAVLLWQ